MMGPRLGTRQREGSRPLALFAAQLGVLGATAAPTESPLAFLYPNLVEQTQRRRRRSQPSAPVASSSSSLLPTTLAASSVESGDPLTTLPDIYAPGADGLWRKTTGVAEPCTMQPTTVTSSSPSAQTTALESAASLEEFDTSTLPDGWKLQEPLARSSLIVIVCLSVAVACAFVVLVLTLVSWRRRVRQERDIERRRRMAKDIPPDDTLVMAASSQRKWVRAGLRWKENVRLSARRRRSARVTSSNDGAGTLRLSRSRLSSSLDLTSDTHSPSLHSATNPIPTIITNPSEEQIVDRAPSPSSTTPPTTPHTPPFLPSSYPPAYHHERVPHYARGRDTPEPGPSKPRAPPSPREEVWPPDEDDMWTAADPNVGDVPEAHAGHISTDDKTLLAARAARASAPQTRSSISADARAPEPDEEMEMAEFALRRRSLGIGGMIEEELDEEDEASPSYARHQVAEVFPAPPRPLTERASEKMRGEYAYAFGRGDAWAGSAPMEEMVASAPPLDFQPSAPPEPSAPPGEDEPSSLPVPSAPPGDDESEPTRVPLPPLSTDSSH